MNSHLTDLPASNGIEGPRRHVPLWMLALFTLSGTLGMHIFVPALPSAAAGLHSSPGAMQLTISVYIAGLAIGQLVYGPVSDRFGRRPTLIGGLIPVHDLRACRAVCAKRRRPDRLTPVSGAWRLRRAHSRACDCARHCGVARSDAPPRADEPHGHRGAWSGAAGRRRASRAVRLALDLHRALRPRRSERALRLAAPARDGCER